MNDRCNILENDVVRLESCRRRTNRLKKNEAITYRSNDPYLASNAFLKSLFSKEETKNANVVAGVVRALLAKKFKKHIFQAIQDHIPEVSVQFESKMYQQLRQNYLGFACEN